MFCPRCGSPTVDRDGRLYCQATGMDFSPVVADDLAVVAEQPPAELPAPPVGRGRWGGRWHCPADAELMVESDGRITCPRCSRSLPGRLVYMLIELHVHPPSSDQ